MPEIDDIKAQRFKFLHYLWDSTGGDQNKRMLIRQVSEPLKLDEKEARTIVQYLAGESLIVVTTHGFNVPSYLDASLYITHKGIVEVEQILSKPESPTQHFPPSVVNYINVGTMTNSNIAQASHDAYQNITLNEDVKSNLTALIDTLKEILNKQCLYAEQQEILKSDVSTLESQINSPRPKTGIISDCLSSAKGILESASTIAVTVAPVITQISSIIGMIR